MTRLIDADWLKSEKVYSHERQEYVVPVYTIDMAKTIGRPHGEWIETYYSIDGVGASRFKCTKCEKEISTYGEPYNFCPNCGADMRTKTPCDSCIDDSDCDRCDVPLERR